MTNSVKSYRQPPFEAPTVPPADTPPKTPALLDTWINSERLMVTSHDAQAGLTRMVMRCSSDQLQHREDLRTWTLRGAAGVATFFFGIGVANGLSIGSHWSSIVRSSFAWTTFGALFGAAIGQGVVRALGPDKQSEGIDARVAMPGIPDREWVAAWRACREALHPHVLKHGDVVTRSVRGLTEADRREKQRAIDYMQSNADKPTRASSAHAKEVGVDALPRAAVAKAKNLMVNYIDATLEGPEELEIMNWMVAGADTAVIAALESPCATMGMFPTQTARDVYGPVAQALIDMAFGAIVGSEHTGGERTARAYAIAQRKDDLAQALAELNDLSGLEQARALLMQVVKIAQFNRLRTAQGLRTGACDNNLLLLGNPGTGKTTLARIYGRILYGLGVTDEPNKFVAASRDDLVDRFVGGTTAKTKALLERCIGGVLFIDEAYALFEEGDQHNYGREAIDAIVEFADRHRNDFVLVLAGYPVAMAKLLASNAGLSRRITRQLTIPDYEDQALKSALHKFLSAQDFEMQSDDVDAVIKDISAGRKYVNFGNVGEVRRRLDLAKGAIAERVCKMAAPTFDDLKKIKAEDFGVHVARRSVPASAPAVHVQAEGDGSEAKPAKLQAITQTRWERLRAALAASFHPVVRALRWFVSSMRFGPRGSQAV